MNDEWKKDGSPGIRKQLQLEVSAPERYEPISDSIAIMDDRLQLNNNRRQIPDAILPEEEEKKSEPLNVLYLPEPHPLESLLLNEIPLQTPKKSQELQDCLSHKHALIQSPSITPVDVQFQTPQREPSMR